MPFVDLFSKDDFASIYYTTNTPFGNVGGLDPEKPTVVILHPLFLDTTWLDNHLGDPRLYNNFNLVAFDMRCTGRSLNRPSGRHDSWVDAADLALCLQKLHLPPVHILALEPNSTNCALRFAALFSDFCLSLTLCNVPSPTEPKWSFSALDEAMQRWCFAPDMETFEHAGIEAVKALVGPDCDTDLQDELIAYWATKTPLKQRIQIAESLNVLINRVPLDPNILATITQPVLLIHGEKNEMYPPLYAEQLAGQLTGVEGGVVLYRVKGGSSNLSLKPTSSSITNQVFVKFISRLPPARSDISLPQLSREGRMRQALAKLADITNTPSLALGDPLCPLSFSCLTDEVVKRQTELLKVYAKAKESAFSPLGPDGRPLRRYSIHKSTHWFQPGSNNLSISDSSFLSSPAKARDTEKFDDAPARDDAKPEAEES